MSEKDDLLTFDPLRFVICAVGLFSFFMGAMRIFAWPWDKQDAVLFVIAGVFIGCGFGWLYQMLWLEGERLAREEKRRRGMRP